MAALTQARAKEYFNYDPLTGVLFFKERQRHEFTPATYAKHMKKVGKPAGGIMKLEGYRKVCVDGKYHPAHRIAWLIMTGEYVQYPDFEIDHINGNPDDNRWENLRKVTKSENQRNASQRINNTSGVHGVNWKPKYNNTPGDGRWVARIWNGPRHVYLGSFRTLYEANIARKAAERVLGFTRTDEAPSDFAHRRKAAKEGRVNAHHS